MKHNFPARAVRRIYRNSRNWVANRVNAPVLVLLYHRVTTLLDDPQQLAVNPANFRAQLTWLRSRYPIVRMESDWSSVREPSVAITFDDGYADNASEALPILEELEVPTTFFIATGYIDSDSEFWWDELEQIVLGNHAVPPIFKYADARTRLERQTDTPAARRSLFGELHPLLKRFDPETREEWLAALRKWAGLNGVARPTHRSMNREAIARLASSPFVTMGAHTVSHARLSALSLEQQRHEIADSKVVLEKLTGKRVSLFSYPFGQSIDYNAETVYLVREAGFTKAVSAIWGQTHRWTDPFQIPRVWVGNWDSNKLANNLKKYWII